MVQEVKGAIASKIKSIYPTAIIYDEDVPQNFKKPSFLVSSIEEDYEKRLGNKFTGLLFFDVAYFSDKPVTSIKADCIEKKQALLRAFDLIGTFRAIEKKGVIEDNVLHITFKVRYSEMKILDEIKMQTKETNTNL